MEHTSFPRKATKYNNIQSNSSIERLADASASLNDRSLIGFT